MFADHIVQTKGEKSRPFIISITHVIFFFNLKRESERGQEKEIVRHTDRQTGRQKQSSNRGRDSKAKRQGQKEERKAQGEALHTD